MDYLISVVNGPIKEGEDFLSNNTPRNTAIYLLGKLRSKEAVQHLIKRLNPMAGQNTKIMNLKIFTPAGFALIEIGLPSVPPLIELLKTEKNIVFREEYIKIIVAIKGIPETELLFEEMLKKEKDSAKIENIKAAQELLKDPKYKGMFENAAKYAQGN